MFRRLGPQAVESDLGFSVKFTDRFSVEYREGGKLAEIYVEHGAIVGDKVERYVAPDVFERWTGDDTSPPNTPQEQARLMKNLSDAFDALDVILVISGPALSPVELRTELQKLLPEFKAR